MFKSELIRRVSIDPRKILLQRKKNATMSKAPIPDESNLLVQVIIIDLSAVNYIDPSGVEQLGLIQNEFEQLEISIYLASASGIVNVLIIFKGINVLIIVKCIPLRNECIELGY